MMRRVVLGLLMAGSLLPAMATAQQEGDRRPDGRPEAEHRGGPPPGGERRGPPPGVPQAEARPQAQAQPQLPQPQQRPAFNGGGRPDFRGGRPGGEAPQGRPDQGQPQGQLVRPDSRGYRQPGGGDRFAPGQPGGRFDGRAPVGDLNAPRPQGGPAVAPGSGGYRPQPGQFGYRGEPGRPGGQGYRPGGPGGPGGPGARPAPPPPARGGGWNRGWRDDRRFDFRSYRIQNNYIFRQPHYYAPRGWGYGYRRFAPGITLWAGLFDQGYWIDDPFYYRLPPAWGPYRWIRYYNDALLVDTRSGMVVDTVYDLFW